MKHPVYDKPYLGFEQFRNRLPRTATNRGVLFEKMSSDYSLVFQQKIVFKIGY